MSSEPESQFPKLRIGLIGAGSWGRNYLRVLGQLGALAAACDTDPATAQAIATQNPGLTVHTDPAELIKDPEIDAVVIAAPPTDHHALAMAALYAGKHCLVEKPLARSADEAAGICQLAADRRLTLMVAHILVYHPAVVKLRELVDQGFFGDIYYLASTRANLGRIRRSESVLQSLAPHDISIARHLLGGNPLSVSANAGSYVQRETGISDIASLNLRFAGGELATIAVSWLDPEKVRSVKLVGSERMALFNDMEPRYKLQIHEKGVDWSTFNEPAHGSFLKVRSGDVQFPFISPEEPLIRQCREFVAAVTERRSPLTPGADGLAVARILEAAEQSAVRGGAPISLPD